MIKSSIEKLKALDAAGELEAFVANHPILSYVKYTKLHREVVLNLAKKHGVNLPSLKFHDLDKFLLYWFYEDSQVQDFHWQNNAHHHTDSTDEDTLTEMVLDWESAPYTKPDKPLNAYDTLYRWYSSMIDKVLPILKKYGLDVHQENPKAISEEEFEARCAEISVDDVVADVREAINHFEH